jgi:hypothetical protein
MRGGGKPEGKRCFGHPGRIGDLSETRRCGEGRSALVGAHGVTRGAKTKRKPPPLPKLIDVLCLGCRDGKSTKHGRNDHSLHNSLPICCSLTKSTAMQNLH